MKKSDVRRKWEVKREFYKGIEDVMRLCARIVLGFVFVWVCLVVMG
ncbi:MAG: hypothetical protein K6C05_03000 [Anaerovibrio sp.]|nr:hypothetical protein [Anaerovibrio sp.]MCR5175799.1 hypothetical protein [Anaerovibrio sp.]